MIYFKNIVLLAVVVLAAGCSQKQIVVLEDSNFNNDWFFIIPDTIQPVDDNYLTTTDFTKWQKVALPHTPKIEPKVVNNQWQGISWYAKTFSLSPAMKDKRLFLKFEAAMNVADVWVNNKKLITHQGGYLPFTVDFTDVAYFDKENIVRVKLNNKDNPITGPKPLASLDFNTYGGIYRNVWLVAKNPLHITDPILANQVASGGVFVTYPKVSKKQATINVKTHIKNKYVTSQSFKVVHSLFKGDEKVLSKESANYLLHANQDKQFALDFILDQPALWSPATPNLYHLKTEILQDGKVVDNEVTRIGIKNIKFVGQDFYLNGEKTFLRGVNRHQEYPFVGYALSNNANYRDAKKIKDTGFDYVRLSHYPQSPAFMDACDELGIITIDAILGWQYFSEDPAFQKHVFQTARDLIRRDRNHASVIAWEVSLNESWMPESFIDILTAIAKEEYPTNQCFTAGWQSYGYDIFLQARQHRLEHYDTQLKKPYNVSEYGDWEYYAMNAGLNQDSWGDLLQSERSSRQLRGAGEKALLQQATNLQEAHNDNLNTPAFADGYWVMFDYNRGYANDLEASGIMDIFRLPKPSYYFYKSQRDATHPYGKPMIHIANLWTQESPLDVKVFSNCDEVELFLNGKSLGKQQPDNNTISKNLKHPPFTFAVDVFSPGSLEAKGYINKKMVTNHVVRTPNKPAFIEVLVDNEIPKLKQEQGDIYFVHARVTDDNGTVISNYTGKLKFNVAGNAQLLGENPIACEAGIASILLKTSSNVTALKITARSLDSPLIFKD